MSRRRGNPNKATIPPTIDGTVTVGANSYVSTLQAGWTLTSVEDPADITASTKGFMDSSGYFMNQHIQGFGAGALQPSNSSGVWLGSTDWSDLDTIVNTVKANGWMSLADEGFITLCGCPKWMKKDPAGTYTDGPITDITDPDYNRWKLGTRTSADWGADGEFDYKPPWVGYLDDFVDLCVAVAERYNWVQHFNMWNEGKGFYSSSLGRYDYEYYQVMHNRVWTALKASPNVHPDIKLYGPYPVVSAYGWDQTGKWADDGGVNQLEGDWGHADKGILEWIRYWAINSIGSDGMALDIRNNNKDYEAYDYTPIDPSAAKPWPYGPAGYYWPVGPFASCDKYADFQAYFEYLATTFPSLYGASNPNGINLATIDKIWTEYYCNPKTEFLAIAEDPNPVATEQEDLAINGWSLIKLMESGMGQKVLFWGPKGGNTAGFPDKDVWQSNPLALWRSDNDAATGLVAHLAFFKDHFSAGTQIKTTTSDHNDILALATATHIIAINKSRTNTYVIDIDGTPTTMTPFDVEYITR